MRANNTSISYRVMTNPLVLMGLIGVIASIVPFSQDMGIDEGIWNYIARMWLDFGIPPYTGAVENKPPGIIFVFALSNILFGLTVWFPKILAVGATVLTSYGIYLIGNRVCNRAAGIFGMILFGVIMSSPAVGSFAVFTERFMVLFSTWAFVALLISQNVKTGTRYISGMFLSGFLLGWAVVFKQIALCTAGGMVLFYFALTKKGSSPYRNNLRDLLMISGGMICANALSIIFLLMNGVHFRDYVDCVWRLLWYSGVYPYASSQVNRISSFLYAWNQPELIFFYGFFYLFIVMRKKIMQFDVPFWGIVWWLAFDFLGVNVPGTYWSHQIQQAMPSFALIGGIVLGIFFESRVFSAHEKRRRISQAAILIILFGIQDKYIIDYMYKKSFFYTDNYLSAGGKELGLWIKNRTNPDDYILVYDEYSSLIQLYSGRKSPTRHFSRMFVHMPSFFEELRSDLAKNMPEMILFRKTLTTPQWLQQYLDQKEYRTNGIHYNFIVYEKIKT